MKTGGRWPIAVITAACAIILLGLVVAWYGLDRFTPRKEVDPLALVQLGVTLLVGFYLTHYVNQRSAESKVEREILMEAGSECRTAAKLAVDTYQDCCNKRDDAALRSKLNRELKALGWCTWTLELLLRDCGVQANSPTIKNAVTEMVRFRRLATKTLPAEPSRAEVIEVETAFRDLHLTLSRLGISINRSN